MGIKLSKKSPPTMGTVSISADDMSVVGSVMSTGDGDLISHPSFTTGGNYAMNTFDIIPFDVHFIRFDKFKSLGRFPSNSEDVLTPYKTIDDRDSAFTIFISHNWFRGLPEVEGKEDSLIIMNKPDNSKNVKYELCVKGISETLRLHAPLTKDTQTYLWLDYSCLKFHNELSDLDRIMECCDCLFTPIYATESELGRHGGGASDDVHLKGLTVNSYSEYDARLWNGPTNEAYLNRAWCRLEIIYASVIPICRLQNGHVISKSPLPGSSSSSSSSLSPSLSAPSGKGSRSGGSKAGGAISVKRKPAPTSPMSPPNGESTRNIHQKTLEYNDIMRKMFKGGLRYHISHGRRPHVLYGSHEMTRSLPPIIIPPLQSVFFDKYSPSIGSVSIPRDVRLIQKLLDDLKPYMSVVERGYRGDLNSNGEMHGYGTFKYANGDIYEGYWAHDKKFGYGVMKCPHKGLYSGDFREDVPWGKGVYHQENGDVYEGEVRKSLYHSLGSGEPSSLTFANGDKYLGEFKEGRMTGQGTFWYNSGKRSGDVYEGGMFEDLRQGKGTYTSADGAFYSGEWFSNRKHGFGKQVYAGGSSYEGEFRDGHKHGHGKFFYTSGDVHEGNYKKGKMDGPGKFTYATGGVFEGNYKDDLKHGAGTVRHLNGDFFEGVWKDDKKSSGVYRHQNGSMFIPDIREQETF